MGIIGMLFFVAYNYVTLPSSFQLFLIVQIFPLNLLTQRVSK
jgi:hypothetical protein